MLESCTGVTSKVFSWCDPRNSKIAIDFYPAVFVCLFWLTSRLVVFLHQLTPRENAFSAVETVPNEDVSEAHRN